MSGQGHPPKPEIVLHIDFETRSPCDLKKAGVYKYAEDPNTQVICMGYAFGDEPVEIWKRGQPIPERIRDHIVHNGVVFAHNAQFERVVMAGCLPEWPQPALEDWRCTAAMAAALALPRDLGRAAKAVGLSENKDDAGKRLMLKMCQPKSFPPGGKPVWWEEGADLERLYAYCKQDVIVERLLEKKMRPLSLREQKVWELDQKINTRGVLIDRAGVLNAKIITQNVLQELNLEISALTDGFVSAITQTAAIKQWFLKRDIDIDSLDKTALVELLHDPQHLLTPQMRRVLELRQEGSKSSVAKLRAYHDRASQDGRMRDNLMYCGTNTGRWSGRGAQLQNLPRSKLPDIPAAIEEMKYRDSKRIDMFYGPPMSVVSDCLRGFIVAPKGRRLIAADFSNIEGRVLAWLAGHDTLVEDFRNGAKIYENMAAAIYGIPASTITKNSKERFTGKEAVLGGGYQMGWERFMKQAAKSGLHLEEDLAKRTIEVYRLKNKPIVDYWKGLEEASFEAVARPGSKFVVAGTRDKKNEVSFVCAGNILWCRLPSARLLAYPDPRIAEVDTPWGSKRMAVTYMTIDGLTNQWVRDSTYGGKLAENVTSGTARDVMVEAMFALERLGYDIILTVHDEIVAECDIGFGSVMEMERVMSDCPAWLEGCPITAEGFEAERYKK